MMRSNLSTAAELLGASLATIGAGMVWAPFGFIVAGGFLIAGGYLVGDE